ncbi:plasmid mobilization relaxosome protein MobC [Acinetobacter indicus]|uniref:plasmid mobilization relaxosome protein MobC n=1 Tax=Acinetobacter indicus TaxID=756892 RepID=UPI0014400B1E|nr:plasmid mobilization relaxosome protein MobC [Acinetobacter indicus]QIZ57693.1 MobC family plasmid mobilization relaxosome protein [Acinetobacter indicus]
MTKSNLDQVLKFRVSNAVYDWWQAKCEKQGIKKGEPFQKALENAYKKENDPNFSGQDFSLNLEKDLAEKIYQLARYEEVDPDDLIKKMIKEKLSELEKTQDVIDVFEKTSRKELRLKPSLMKIINEQASKIGMKPNQYIISVLTAHTTKDEYFFGTEEAHKLGDSNSQLSAIGRNLNQMAKNMNQGIYESYDREFVERVHQLVKAQVRHVFTLLERNKKRWE